MKLLNRFMEDRQECATLHISCKATSLRILFQEHFENFTGWPTAGKKTSYGLECYASKVLNMWATTPLTMVEQSFHGGCIRPLQNTDIYEIATKIILWLKVTTAGNQVLPKLPIAFSYSEPAATSSPATK